MPAQFWTCIHCGERNPPLTEACRNCSKQHDSPIDKSDTSAPQIYPSRPAKRISFTLHQFLYGFAASYALISCLLRETGFTMVMVFGFGLPVLALLVIEWVVPPLIAIFFGIQARCSLNKAISAIPLVIVYSVISPTIQGKNTALPVLLPWLAAFPSSIDLALPIMGERLVWWGSLFVIALVSAYISRIVSPPSSRPHSCDDSKAKP